MATDTAAPRSVRRLRAADCRLDDFRRVVEVETRRDDYPHASQIVAGAVVYDSELLLPLLADESSRDELEIEIGSALGDGPGIVAFRGAFRDHAVLDRVTEHFLEMIAEQHRQGMASGDHYAKPGANDRVWNSIEKLALIDPEAFVAYFANEMVALTATAWLGPHYRISSQVNLVHPGGEQQSPHRDYHVGFLTDAQAERYPAHVHAMSSALTLQGAVAHVDMPLESGPTQLLPHSQKYEAGFLAWRNPEFIDYFAEHYIQLPLAKGDLAFFNPAVFHAAGTNHTTDVERMANLLQISSAFGRPMETMDTERMCAAVYDALLTAPLTELQRANAIAAAAEGYSFPTNLDRDPPIGGLAPPTQADLLRTAVAERWARERFISELSAHWQKRLTH